MISGMSLNAAYGRIANFYQTNGDFLNTAARKIASGKQMLDPSDGAGDFFRSATIRQENSVSQMIQRDIVSAQNLITVAEKAGSFIINDLNKMNDLIREYQDPTSSADIKMAAKAFFDATASKVNSMIAGAKYSGKNLIADTGTDPLASVLLDPNDITKTLDVSFTSADVADTTGLDITDVNVQTAFDAVYNKATSYMAKVSGYKIGLAAQANMASSRIASNETFDDEIAKLNDAAAMSHYSDRQVKQQMAISMLGQASSGARSVLDLFT